ncbi:MAG: TlyA family RNA methyltransferase [Oscillospiraceae bacterium]|nr:TlyA family RNA methyltransferase [Oscillospiraceae bacterium]
MRLDQALVYRGLLPSRARAKAAVLAGEVTVNGIETRKPSLDAGENDSIELREIHGYVGRGYLKLRKAFEVFGIDVTGKICMDIGASTGGFTQLLLERGAARVYAIDVGTGQLAACLRGDPRVVCLEKTDFRAVTPAQIGPCAFACVDVSFISLRLIFPNLISLLENNGQCVCLLKPQFETGSPVKHGVVKSKKEHVRVIGEVVQSARQEGISWINMTYSPLLGGDGNIEFLLYLSKNDNCQNLHLSINDTVYSAWEDLKS